MQLLNEMQLNDVEKDKIETQTRVIEEEKDAKKKYEPEIDRLNSEIKDLKVYLPFSETLKKNRRRLLKESNTLKTRTSI